MKKIKNYFLMIFFTVFILLLISEVFLRLFHIVPVNVVNESIYPNVLGDYKPSQKLLSDYIIKHRITINSLGLRGKGLEVEKPKNVYRVLVLGDSYTFGSRVNDEETFPFLIEKFLNDSPLLNKRIEVINGGHGAYSTREEYEYLLERGIKLNPDMVIVAWFPNDIKELSREHSWRSLLKKHYEYEPFKTYVRSSALFSFFRIYASYAFLKMKFTSYVPKEEINVFDNEETEKEKILWNLCFNYILKIKNICDEKGYKFLLVALGDPIQFYDSQGFKPQKQLILFSKKRGLMALDTTEKFALKKNSSYYYLLPKDPHFSAKGNHLVAEIIYNFLKEKNLSRENNQKIKVKKN